VLLYFSEKTKLIITYRVPFFRYIYTMSLAFDENGRPFIILREQEKKKRVKGMEAHKVSQILVSKASQIDTL